MTFLEIKHYIILDKKVCNYKLNVTIFEEYKKNNYLNGRGYISPAV